MTAVRCQLIIYSSTFFCLFFLHAHFFNHRIFLLHGVRIFASFRWNLTNGKQKWNKCQGINFVEKLNNFRIGRHFSIRRKKCASEQKEHLLIRQVLGKKNKIKIIDDTILKFKSIVGIVPSNFIMVFYLLQSFITRELFQCWPKKNLEHKGQTSKGYRILS